jgi:hypothetical protein
MVLRVVQVQVILRQTVSRTVRLGVGFSVWQLLPFFFMQGALWREDGSVICSPTTHWLESCRTHTHTLLSLLRLPQPAGPGPRIYIPRNRVVQLYPWALGSLFVTSYDSQGYGGGILSRFHTGQLEWLQWSKVTVTLRLTVSQSVCLDVELLLVLMTKCLLLFDDYGCLCGAPSLMRGRVCRLSRVCIFKSFVSILVYKYLYFRCLTYKFVYIHYI